MSRRDKISVEIARACNYKVALFTEMNNTEQKPTRNLKPPHSNDTRFNNNEFVTTDTEEKAIASPAYSGFRVMPKRG